MTEQEFLDVVRVTRLTSNSREAARLHLVEKIPQKDAASEAGISKQRMTQILKVIENAQTKIRPQPEHVTAALTTPTGINHVIALSASYAVAVQQARASFGDDTNIHVPDNSSNSSFLGDVVGRTDFHLVQSMGRGTVTIHELARLDRVPALGKTVAIEYTQGRGVVAERDRSQTRVHVR
jgi:hypothetical protein